jgi:tetratricopeptide (TPR) repeat protein
MHDSQETDQSNTTFDVTYDDVYTDNDDVSETSWTVNNNEPMTPFERARAHMAKNDLSAAIAECAANSNANNLQLACFHAELLARTGRAEESLALYQHILSHYDKTLTHTDRANLYFIAGRLSRKLSLYAQAESYFQKELELVRDPLAQARIYHDLGRLQQSLFGNCSLALSYYQRELEIEHELLKQTLPCGEDYTSLKLQMQETRQHMGRIYYEQGDLERALQWTLRRI